MKRNLLERLAIPDAHPRGRLKSTDSPTCRTGRGANGVTLDEGVDCSTGSRPDPPFPSWESTTSSSRQAA